MPLLEFWSTHATTGLHSADAKFIDLADHLVWNSSDEALQNKALLGAPKNAFHRKLHLGLFPQPFVGNIRDASVYILFGNPGLSVQDYVDELDTPKYRAQCIANLAGQLDHFAPLHGDALHTGAQKYWNSTFKRLIKETGDRLGIPAGEARAWVLSQVATIEAGAYHSPKFPGGVFENLPSTNAAQAFVNDHVLPRAVREECVVFVWRQARLWDINERPGIKVRDPRKAHWRYLLDEERNLMVNQLVKAHGRRKQESR